MKIARALLTTGCVVACLSIGAIALDQTPTTKPAAKKPAGTPAAKSAAPAHHTVVSTETVTATVVSVDQKTRAVTLKDDSGAQYSFVAEPSVKNLKQVKPGDVVTATYTESVGLVMKKNGGAPSMTSSQGMSTAPEGQQPAGVATSKTTVTVVITAIDPKAPSVTFKGPQGNSHTVKVEDPEKLEGVKVGDTVDIVYTEALSLKVHTPSKK